MNITVRVSGIGSGDVARLSSRLAARLAARSHSSRSTHSPPPGGEGAGVEGAPPPAVPAAPPSGLPHEGGSASTTEA